MINNGQAQRILSVSPQFGKNSAWGIGPGIALLGIFLSVSAQAAVFTVNSPAIDAVDANPGDGVCDAVPPKNICTLRAAIEEANALAGADQIILPSLLAPNVYLLTISTDLTITGNLTITGGGSSTTIIDGNSAVRPNSRVLVIGSGITVSINGVTIRNAAKGVIGVIEHGGGILNAGGTLTLTNSTVSGNIVRNGAGGGIFNRQGILTLINSTVSGNSDGGGIGSEVGAVTLINSTVSGNSGEARGGGIKSNDTTLTLINSTVSGNTGGGFGGGIFNTAAPATLINSMVSGNSSGGNGGGIYSESSTLTLISTTVSGNRASDDGGGVYVDRLGTVNSYNSTITDNLADANLDFLGTGGGVFVFFGVFNFQNTILAGNSRRVFDLVNPRAPSDCVGVINSNGNNLMQTLTGCTVNGGVVIGGGVTVADPKLGPLQSNGGPTQTHALLPGSPAIDAGNATGCRDQFGALIATDQRGFPRSIDGNNDGVARCDIGAYEVFTGSNTSVVAALLPSSRSVQVGTAATVFGTMINTGQSLAAACSISLPSGIPASFQYQTTNPATNQVTGLPNTATSIAPGAGQSFFLAITPTAAFPPTDVQLIFDCANTEPAPVNIGLNTLLLSASDLPAPDIVALAATPSPDPGIVNVPGANGTGAFAVATVNVGATGTITASADTGSAALPVSIFLCQTNPATGQCTSAVGPSVTTTINANATPTFGIFVQGNANVPFNPATNRIFVRFKDAGGVTRGSTSVAVRTQ